MSAAFDRFPQPTTRRDGVLELGGVSLEALAEEYGTPLYAYDLAGIELRVRHFLNTFAEVPFLLAYSVKANGSLALLHRIGALGAGADIVSAGELHRARRAGISADRIVFAGVGKTDAEIRAGLEAGIRAFHVESRGELDRIARIAGEMGRRAPVSLRINPDIASPTPHAYTATGHAASKFGISLAEAEELYRTRWEDPRLAFRGIDLHIGSQILDVGPYLGALRVVLEVHDRLQAEGRSFEYLDLGGGFGIGYEADTQGMALGELARALVPELRARGLALILEPGRSIVAESGLLLTRVLDHKVAGGKHFVVTDAGMTELIRPALYGGFHRIEAVREGKASIAPIPVDVVGPICESGDFLARDRVMVPPEPGELLVVHAAGAYAATMSSNYNARPRAAEVLVEGGRSHLIRHRETLEELTSREVIPSLSSDPAPSADPPSATPESRDR